MCKKCEAYQRRLNKLEDNLRDEKQKSAAYHEMLVTIISEAAGRLAKVTIKREVKEKCKGL